MSMARAGEVDEITERCHCGRNVAPASHRFGCLECGAGCCAAWRSRWSRWPIAATARRRSSARPPACWAASSSSAERAPTLALRGLGGPDRSNRARAWPCGARHAA